MMAGRPSQTKTAIGVTAGCVIARFSPRSEIPVVPVVTGISQVFSISAGSTPENSGANRAFAGEFPLPGKREFMHA
jgi:hypothetical protein